MENISKIREAVRKHHGGFEQATDLQIQRVWDSLPAEVQQRYLDGLAESKKIVDKEKN